MSEKQPNINRLEGVHSPLESFEGNHIDAKALEFNLAGLEQHYRRTLGAASMRAMEGLADPVRSDFDLAA